ncbi:pirin family protein [Ramlibacter sp. 2FC]|uniref:pirin family protein n=1 Tax=Ramlibacter sp. 2FC TaxID=2502188 RepID=UPI0010F93CEC|nr:pirin family protein [Ramlibacter sp. 2FC]
MNTPAHLPFVEQPSRVERLVTGQPTSDGAGVKLRRVLTQDLQQRLDPFLMLDSFASDNPDDYGAGFPDHPHRGFETVTYMIAGRMRHKDSAGHEGLLQNGGVQWMTAGRGLIHSELPEQEEGVMEGFQLWLNLPARDKMCEPGYRDIQSEEIPVFTTPDGADGDLRGSVHVRVIAGSSHGVAGAMQRDPARFPTDPLYLDLHFLVEGATFQQPLPPEHNAFLYVYRGTVEVLAPNGEVTAVPRQQMAILANQGDGVCLHAATDQDTRALLIAGRPLREPIAQYGPFVMNTREQLMQAMDDFRNGRLA